MAVVKRGTRVERRQLRWVDVSDKTTLEDRGPAATRQGGDSRGVTGSDGGPRSFEVLQA